MSAERVMPEPIERVRMALADTPSLGWGPDCIIEPLVPGAAFGRPVEMPDVVSWRALECAMIEPPCCFACCGWRRNERHRTSVYPPSPCVTTRRFTEDCGVTR